MSQKEINLREHLRKRYKELPLNEKKVIGEALVRVNLGVASPGDFKNVALFLKGSGLVAKMRALDPVIEILNEESDKSPSTNREESDTKTIFNPLSTNDEIIGGLHEYEEDSEITEKGKE